MKLLLLSILLTLFSGATQATVVLVYHHVGNNTAKSTTITPKQFERHLSYFQDNGFSVIPLSTLVDSIKTQTPLDDKTIVITFDDGHTDILTNGHPLLKKFGFPYTVFVNPSMVPKESGSFLTWSQLEFMTSEGVIIANHGLDHKSMVKVPLGIPEVDWVNQILSDLVKSEDILKAKLNTSYKYFGLPYGEYSTHVQNRLSDMGYAVFTQQSGAVGLQTELTSIPRFPASMPYDDLETLKTKISALPFNISKETQLSETVVRNGETAVTKVKLDVKDFNPKAVQCFISSLGKAQLTWLNDKEFDMELPLQLEPGRTRSNCTAPSLTKPGRFYWFSKPWFVPNKDGSWYTW